MIFFYASPKGMLATVLSSSTDHRAIDNLIYHISFSQMPFLYIIKNPDFTRFSSSVSAHVSIVVVIQFHCDVLVFPLTGPPYVPISRPSPQFSGNGSQWRGVPNEWKTGGCPGRLELRFSCRGHAAFCVLIASRF